MDDDCKSYPASGGGVNWYCGVGYHFTGDGTYSPDTPGPTSPVATVPTTDPLSQNQPLQGQTPNSDNSCPPGTLNIGTDSSGTATCRGNGLGSSPTTQKTDVLPPVTVSNSDGTTTTTNTSKTSNADGSTTTNTVTCTPSAGGTGSSCIASSNTSNNAAGAPGKSDGTGKGGSASADDVCTKHPELNICSNSQVVGKGCTGISSTIAYSGDAIQGAILKSIADDACAKATPSDASKLYDQMATGNDPLRATLPTKANGTTINISNGNGLDQSGFASSSCFADKSYSYAGQNLVIPFSNICPYLIPLRVAVMVAALMASYFMLSGAILRS